MIEPHIPIEWTERKYSRRVRVLIYAIGTIVGWAFVAGLILIIGALANVR